MEFKYKIDAIANSYLGFYKYCNCCGKRWNIDEDNIKFDAEPLLYGEKIQDASESFLRGKCFIHFKTGDIKKIDLKDKEDE